MIPITVIRSEWTRGSNDSLLYTESKKRCCMGFVCQAGGASDKAMKHIECVQDVAETLAAKFKARLVKTIKTNLLGEITIRDQDWVDQAYIINDDPKRPYREQELISLFKDNGFDLTFVD